MRRSDLQTVQDFDVGAIVIKHSTAFVKRRPITVSLWIFGLLLAAFANGFTVSDGAMANYNDVMRDVADVEMKQVHKVRVKMQEREREYRNAKGWFWTCDAKCKQAYDRYQIATEEHSLALQKRDALLKEARQEVGIWSTIGVADVRKSFWSAWQSGKDTAARLTMYDFVFAAMRSNEESLASFVLQMVLKYVGNLTIGLISAMFYFIYATYSLVVAYGSTAASGFAFFLLVVVASLSVVGTYLLAIYGTVAGGGVFLLKQAAKSQLEAGSEGGRAQRLRYQNYGAGPAGYRRTHQD
mmetsp:Transcript_47218/g.86686  ORF Transcript_47218/g.86686 Transcript_47218/m.86686 type:complete len:297 (-) Transcript_47218:79-969(-)